MNSPAGGELFRSAGSGVCGGHPGDGRWGLGAFLGVQALVEYGVLNSLLRDASLTFQRAGGWAAQNWVLVGGILVVLLVLAFRRR